MKNLSNKFINHDFPPLVLKFSFLQKLVHFFENIKRIKHWYVKSAITSCFEKSNKKLNVLDIGCGSGVFSLPYSTKHKKSNFICADKNLNNLNFIKKYIQHHNLSNVTPLEFELGKTIINHKFDLILCISVLELVEKDVEALSDIKKILNDNGVLLLYTPINGKRVLPFFEYLYWHFFKSTNYNLHNNFAHKYTKESIRQKIQDAGLNVIESKMSYGFFGKIQFEIFTLLELSFVKSSFLLAPIFLILILLLSPLLLLLMILDYFFSVKNGNGILLIIKKPPLS